MMPGAYSTGHTLWLLACAHPYIVIGALYLAISVAGLCDAFRGLDRALEPFDHG